MASQQSAQLRRSFLLLLLLLQFPEALLKAANDLLQALRTCAPAALPQQDRSLLLLPVAYCTPALSCATAAATASSPKAHCQVLWTLLQLQ
jgi:hypothetical protein